MKFLSVIIAPSTGVVRGGTINFSQFLIFKNGEEVYEGKNRVQ